MSLALRMERKPFSKVFKGKALNLVQFCQSATENLEQSKADEKAWFYLREDSLTFFDQFPTRRYIWQNVSPSKTLGSRTPYRLNQNHWTNVNDKVRRQSSLSQKQISALGGSNVNRNCSRERHAVIHNDISESSKETKGNRIKTPEKSTRKNYQHMPTICLNASLVSNMASQEQKDQQYYHLCHKPCLNKKASQVRLEKQYKENDRRHQTRLSSGIQTPKSTRRFPKIANSDKTSFSQKKTRVFRNGRKNVFKREAELNEIMPWSSSYCHENDDGHTGLQLAEDFSLLRICSARQEKSCHFTEVFSAKDGKNDYNNVEEFCIYLPHHK